MDDPHRAPKDRDRADIGDRIRRAAEEGRISAADRDIRLRNVASAQSMGELDLIGRDLDLLETSVSPGSAAPPPSTPPLAPSPSFQTQAIDALVDRQRGGFRSGLIVGIAVLVFAIIGAGVVALFITSTDSDTSSSSDGLFEPEPLESASPADDPVDKPGVEPSASNASYALTAAGIRSFLANYRRTFSTNLVVQLVMYPDYAVVQVPQANKNRHGGALYRKGEGWQDFGGITANFPGSRAIDVRKLDVDALVRNIARARRTLNVEKPAQVYVILQHIGTAEPQSSVDIHVNNEFNESGYLATRLDGTVERSYPYQVQ